MRLVLVAFAGGLLAGVLGCATNGETVGSGGGRVTGPFARPCDDAMDDVYAQPPSESLPNFTDSTRGDPVPGNACVGAGECTKCALDVGLDADKVDAALRQNGYTGAKVARHITTYRIAYRTERLASGEGQGPRDGISSALVLVPDEIVDPETLVVVAPDAVGFGAACAPSLEDQLSPTLDDDHTLNLAMAEHGYLTVVPDGAGIGFGAAAAGFGLAEDEAHSLLDATRALHALLPKEADAKSPVQPKKIVLVGFAGGGHAVLSAQALAGSYGLSGELVGVVALAPAWQAPRTYGSLLAASGKDALTPEQIALELLYFYGHGELYDGPGGGEAMFRAEKRSTVRDRVERRCLAQLVAAVPDFAPTPTDVFEPTFVHQVSACAIAGGGASCKGSDPSTWNPRFSADRPSSDPKGAPILVWQGGADTVIGPAAAVCGKDKLERDLKGHPDALNYCGDDKATHGGVVERDVDQVLAFIDHAVGLGPAPKACAPFAPKDPAGHAIACSDVPPNGD